MKNAVAVIASDLELRKRIMDFLRFDSEIYSIIQLDSIKSLLDADKAIQWVGFIIDFKTMLKSDEESKNYFLKLTNVFPLMRVRFEQTGGVTGVVDNQNYAGEQVNEVFFKQLVTHFVPRKIRSSSRVSTILNAIVKTSDGRKLQTSIIDVSLTGAFVIYNDTDFKIGDVVEITMCNLTVQPELKATIRWMLPWGDNKERLAGFGVEFDKIPEHFEENLREFLADQ
jgi:hypothetical protein